METVFSGIQPSGELHLGNYLGAVRNWVALQGEFRCFYCIVDYHAITQRYEPATMAARARAMAIDVLACGVDPERATLFIQSSVPEHTELAWVLASVTPHGDLERMTQFKDKAEHNPDNINAGLAGIRGRGDALRADSAHVDAVLARGAAEARKVAVATMARVRAQPDLSGARA